MASSGGFRSIIQNNDQASGQQPSAGPRSIVSVKRSSMGRENKAPMKSNENQFQIHQLACYLDPSKAISAADLLDFHAKPYQFLITQYDTSSPLFIVHWLNKAKGRIESFSALLDTATTKEVLALREGGMIQENDFARVTPDNILAVITATIALFGVKKPATPFSVRTYEEKERVTDSYVRSLPYYTRMPAESITLSEGQYCIQEYAEDPFNFKIIVAIPERYEMLFPKYFNFSDYPNLPRGGGALIEYSRSGFQQKLEETLRVIYNRRDFTPISNVTVYSETKRTIPASMYSSNINLAMTETNSTALDSKRSDGSASTSPPQLFAGPPKLENSAAEPMPPTPNDQPFISSDQIAFSPAELEEWFAPRDIGPAYPSKDASLLPVYFTPVPVVELQGSVHPEVIPPSHESSIRINVEPLSPINLEIEAEEDKSSITEPTALNITAITPSDNISSPRATVIDIPNPSIDVTEPPAMAFDPTPLPQRRKARSLPPVVKAVRQLVCYTKNPDELKIHPRTLQYSDELRRYVIEEFGSKYWFKIKFSFGKETLYLGKFTDIKKFTDAECKEVLDEMTIYAKERSLILLNPKQLTSKEIHSVIKNKIQAYAQEKGLPLLTSSTIKPAVLRPYRKKSTSRSEVNRSVTVELSTGAEINPSANLIGQFSRLFPVVNEDKAREQNIIIPRSTTSSFIAK
jgi:hypothetical protein